MSIKFKNNSKRLQKEFDDLENLNPSLFGILQYVKDLCFVDYNKHITVTHIFRTQSEQEKFYKGRKDKKGKKSPHQFYQAVDIRQLDTTAEIDKVVVKKVNERFQWQNDERWYKYVAKHHDIGLGPHIHLQFLLNPKYDLGRK